MKSLYAWIAANQLVAFLLGALFVGLIIWAVVYFTSDDKTDVIVEPATDPAVNRTIIVPTRTVPVNGFVNGMTNTTGTVGTTGRVNQGGAQVR